MKALFLRLKSYGLLRWTYIIAIALIVIPGSLIFIINIFSQPLIMLELFGLSLFCCLMLFGLPLLLGGILDLISNNRIPLRPVLLFFNSIIIIGLVCGDSYLATQYLHGSGHYNANKLLLVNFPREESVIVETVINKLDEKFGENNYDVIVSLIKRYNSDSIKNGYEVYTIYSVNGASINQPVFECRYRSYKQNNLTVIKQVDNKYIKGIDNAFVINLKKEIDQSLDHFMLYGSGIALIDTSLLAKMRNKKQ